AGRNWAPERLAPEYIRLFTALVQRRRGQRVVSEAATGRTSGKALRRLAKAYPWPTERPQDAAPGQEQGWLAAGSDTMLASVLSPGPRLVVEIGAWLGLSTRFMVKRAPRATVISVDTWQGSPEHQRDARYAKLLPHLYETYLARCWDYRDRIVPLRMKSG